MGRLIQKIKIAVGILVAGILVYSIYVISNNTLGTEREEASVSFEAEPSAPNTLLQQATSSSLISAPLPPKGFLEYRNETYHFSVFYPQNLSMKEYKEVGSAITVTFAESLGENSFQIYVTPYGEKFITKEEFLLDVPSGMMEQPVDVTIDGAPGTIFFSSDALLGETREVWFINSGFLYEVTAPKDLDSWISDIMKTWKFL